MGCKCNYNSQEYKYSITLFEVLIITEDRNKSDAINWIIPLYCDIETDITMYYNHHEKMFVNYYIRKFISLDDINLSSRYNRYNHSSDEFDENPNLLE